MSNHLIKKTLQLMTVKEVAAELNVNGTTIRRIINRLFPHIVENGKTTYLTETQVTAVKLEIGGGRNDLCNVAQVKNIKTNLEKKMIIQQAMILLNEEVEDLKQENNLLQLENKTLQIELDEEKSWYSVKRIQSMGFLKDKKSRQLWSPLRKWSIANDYQIKTIFDANYGTIKTYHRDSWSAVYEIDFTEEK